MHEALIFSENFFSYFNTAQTTELSDAVLDASIKRYILHLVRSPYILRVHLTILWHLRLIFTIRLTAAIRFYPYPY